MSSPLAFISGVVLGAVIVGLIVWMRRKDAMDIARELTAQAQARQEQDLDAVLTRVKDAFGALSLDVLSKGTAELVRLANETLAKHTRASANELAGKKDLIDQSLQEMNTGLQNLQTTLATFEKDRAAKFSEVSTQLKQTAEQTGKLQDTANALRTAFAGAKARGQWGERMAEDVLRLAGFIEDVNYRKQKALKGAGTVPDYTFLLPQGLSLNMDVKFPLDNYMKYLEASTDLEKERHKVAFVKDVKDRIKEVTTRDYIDPSSNTVDYALVFIPNEQVYAFINEHDRDLLDDAMKRKVIVCSPLTLYAILAIIRQAVDNFNVEKTTSQVMALLGKFDKQWRAFIRSFDKMGQKLDDARTEYDHLVTMRRRQLERPLEDIKDLRVSGKIPPPLLHPATDEEPETEQ